MRARRRRARVVDALAVDAGEALRAPAQVLVGRGVLAGAAVLAGLVRAAVVEVCEEVRSARSGSGGQQHVCYV